MTISEVVAATLLGVSIAWLLWALIRDSMYLEDNTWVLPLASSAFFFLLLIALQ